MTVAERRREGSRLFPASFWRNRYLLEDKIHKIHTLDLTAASSKHNTFRKTWNPDMNDVIRGQF